MSSSHGSNSYSSQTSIESVNANRKNYNMCFSYEYNNRSKSRFSFAKTDNNHTLSKELLDGFFFDGFCENLIVAMEPSERQINYRKSIFNFIQNHVLLAISLSITEVSLSAINFFLSNNDPMKITINNETYSINAPHILHAYLEDLSKNF
jgi:hypothetical protein